MDGNSLLLFIYYIYFILLLGFLWFIQKKSVIFNFWLQIFSCPIAVTTMKVSLYLGLQFTDMYKVELKIYASVIYSK